MPHPLAGHQIYEEEMILKGHGFPVWFGDPYGGAEIEIGDIGYMREGIFVHVMKCNFNFNEFRTTPVDFNGPIYSLSLERREAGAEAGVSALPGVGVNSQISLTSSRNTCAMLNVEEGVADYTRCSDVDKEAVGENFLQNARKWLAEAVRGHQIASNISIERLILVTGFYKSANWEAAVLYSSSSAGKLTFTIKTSQAGGGILINWDSVQHLSPDYSTGHRHPPQTDLNEPQDLGARGDITRGTNNPTGPRVSFAKCCHLHADRTQCTFLRGFRIRGRLFQKDQVIPLLASEESKLSWGERVMQLPVLNSKTFKRPGGESESSQRSASAYDNLEAIEEFPDTNFCDQLYGTIAVKKFMENDSNFVLVHDDELIGILERDAAALSSARLSEPKVLSQSRTHVLGADAFGVPESGSLLAGPSSPLTNAAGGRVNSIVKVQPESSIFLFGQNRAGIEITGGSAFSQVRGVQILETLSPGDGKTYPKKGDKVTFHYIGTLEDGRVFYSTRDLGAPFETEIGVGKVIKGWDEGIPQLSLGQKAVLEISPDYAYGRRGFPPVIPPNSTLIFEVELLEIFND